VRDGKIKITALDRLKNAFEQIELRVTGMTARLDYLHCNACAITALKHRGIETFMAVGGLDMDEAFEPIFVAAEDASEDESEVADITYLGREPDMKGPLRVVHQWRSDDLAVRREVVDLLNKFGFLVEWDLSDEKAIIIHN